ncbi:MAG: DoxX family protein [Acidobacteria bacterium]|nr:DoxX family protein [Acidobacteriota bacterium]
MTDIEDFSTKTGRPWAGYIVTGLVTAFLLMDAVVKFIQPAGIEENVLPLGYTMEQMIPVGIILLICLVIYLIPQTSILGAILLTGYLGGAVATHFRVGSPLFSHTLFPVYIGVLVWLGIFLREPRLRSIIPFRR